LVRSGGLGGVYKRQMLDTLREGGLRSRWGEPRRRARAALAQFVVEMDVPRRIDSCSLAEKQHVLLARAL
ncbi:hypothetical protein CDT87_20775, partial [Cronobacter sakazakii]